MSAAENSFLGLVGREAVRSAALGFIERIWRRGDLEEVQILYLKLVLDDLRALPAQRPRRCCNVSVSRRVVGFSYWDLSISETHFSLSTGGAIDGGMGSDSHGGFEYHASADHSSDPPFDEDLSMWRDRALSAAADDNSTVSLEILDDYSQIVVPDKPLLEWGREHNCQEDDAQQPTCSEFICPECGGKKVAEATFVDGPAPGTDADAWDCVLQMSRCAGCSTMVPDHLGYRWREMSIEQAKVEWREIYRKQCGERKPGSRPPPGLRM